MSSAAFSKTVSERGMFDPNFPLQGIFDDQIFDTVIVAALNQILIPAFVHGNADITTATHGNEVIVIK